MLLGNLADTCAILGLITEGYQEDYAISTERTKDYMLAYKKSNQLQPIGYTDSDFAGCIDSRKSTPSYFFLMAGGMVYWKSVKQTLVASSTMETEFVACYEASNQVIWLRNFVFGFQLVDLVERPLQLYCDNRAAELYCKSDKSLARSRHIDIKFLVVKDRVRNNTVSVDRLILTLLIHSVKDCLLKCS